MRPMLVLVLVPGCADESSVTRAARLPSVGPAQALDLYVNGFHYAAGDPSMQMEVDHYCHARADGIVQCALYAADDEPRLIGVEHVVAREVFDALPTAEKVLWHPHTYEVKSGALVAPDLPPSEEHALMEQLVSTYGKTWHLWDSDVDALPLDAPMLMKGFTADGQLDPALLAARDARLGVDSAARRADRADIVDPGFDPIVLEEPVVCASPIE